MLPPVQRFRALVATDTGRKFVKYSVASVVNVLAAQVVVIVAFGFLHWPARVVAVLAAVVAAIPAFWLSRRWVWGRTGRSHLRYEVLPFWTLALTGMALSTWIAGVAERFGADVTDSRFLQTLILMGSGLGVSGTFWVLRFVLLNGILFADRKPWQPRDVVGLPDMPMPVADVTAGGS